MKIEGILSSGVIDSDKMTDAESEIFEKQHALCILAEKYNIPFMSIMFGNKPMISQHMISKENFTPDEATKIVNKLFNILNGKIISLSNKQLEILPSELKQYMNKEENNEDEKWKSE